MGMILKGQTLAALVPVYNNADTLEELYCRLTAVFDSLGCRFTIVLINDASPDHSAEVLNRLAADPATGTTVKVHTNQKNCGQQASLKKALSLAECDLYVSLDADLQDSPEDISLMAAELVKREADCVFACRENRYQSRRRMLTSRIFKWLAGRLTGLPAGSGAFILFRRSVRDRVLQSSSRYFYLSGLVAAQSQKIAVVTTSRQMRPSGHSAYSPGLRLQTALQNLVCMLQNYRHRL